MVLRPLRGLALAAALSASSYACADIWGFEQGGDLPSADAGAPGAMALDASADVVGVFIDAGSDVDGGVGVGVMDSGSADSSAIACGTGSLCVPSAPSGWQGPYAIIEGPTSGLLACPAASYVDLVHSGQGAPVVQSATCSCSCDVSDGGTCSAPVVNYVDPMTCGTCAPGSVVSGCTPIGKGKCAAVSVASSAPTGGTCTPRSSFSTLPPTWPTGVNLCGLPVAPTAGSCDADQVCIPTTGLPAEEDTYCVATEQAGSCPSTYYTIPHESYSGGADTRRCTPCACGPLLGSACDNAALVTYTDGACMQKNAAIIAPFTCRALMGAALTFDAGAPSGGSCAATGGAPVGDFVPTTSLTICCNR